MDTRIGQVMILAGIVSPSQVEVALIDQQMQPHLKLGDIFVMRGWIDQATVEYFATMLPLMKNARSKLRLGEYLVCSYLLTEAQVEELLAEQEQTPIPIGRLAVRRGWVKQTTIDFFLDTFGLRPKTTLSNEIHSNKVDSQLYKQQKQQQKTLLDTEDLFDETLPSDWLSSF